MVLRHSPVAIMNGVLGALLAAGTLYGGESVGLVLQTDSSGEGVAVARACAQASELLQEHGWVVPNLVVSVSKNPFDATVAGVDISFSTSVTPADAAFHFMERVVGLNLSAHGRRPHHRLLAALVAAHLSGPDGTRRVEWERGWQARLRSGDLVSTALIELVWRVGADEAIRTLGSRPEAEDGVLLLEGLGVGDPLVGVGEVALAGLLKPSALGFTSLGPMELRSREPFSSGAVSLSSPGIRVLQIPPDSDAAGVLLVRSEGLRCWVAARYPIMGDFDVVALTEGEELPVPLRGVSSAAIIMVGLRTPARASLAFRPLNDFPIDLEHWEFRAVGGSVEIGWETASHADLSAFVVEALGKRGQAWDVRRRAVVPTSDDGTSSFRYAFVDDDTRGIEAYRVLALTTHGFLSEVGTFPLATSTNWDQPAGP